MGRVVRARSTLILLAAAALLAGCSEKPKPPVRVEAPIAPQSVQAAAPQPQVTATPLPPASAADVRAALQRVFGDALNLDEAASPNFVTGDFNSDDSQDVMAIVRPNASQLEKLNSEVADWTISNPRHEWLPPLGVHTFKLPPPPAARQTVSAGERVIAVIHGVDAQGWRNPEARQVYLLREVAGTIAGSTHLERLPRQVKSGDVVRETVGGERGFLYYSGAKYVWQKGAPPQQKMAAVRTGNPQTR